MILDQWQLELYRHKIHNMTKPKMSTIMQGWESYWKEYGAFISIMPRQSGKTTMLEKIADNYVNAGEKVHICGIPKINKRFGNLKVNLPYSNYIFGLEFGELNLIIDEFQYIDSMKYLGNILEHPWKSVTMAGTIR